MGNYHLYHVEGNNNNEMALVDTKEELNAHNQYTCDLNTGAITLAMSTFSEVALVADTAKPWEGKFDYTWYDAEVDEFSEGYHEGRIQPQRPFGGRRGHRPAAEQPCGRFRRGGRGRFRL